MYQKLIFEDIYWNWFKGNEISAKQLQSIGIFRSQVLFNLGLRKSFGPFEMDFGDLRYVDFESYHIVAYYKSKLIGSIRVTPPMLETVTFGAMGMKLYLETLEMLGGDLNNVIEINRLMVDPDYRDLSLGRTLIYAAVALIENIWDRSKMLILGSAGHCMGQTEFVLKHTDFQKIPNREECFSQLFNDKLTFLYYKQAPYLKGVELISFFQNLFKQKDTVVENSINKSIAL